MLGSQDQVALTTSFDEIDRQKEIVRNIGGIRNQQACATPGRIEDRAFDRHLDIIPSDAAGPEGHYPLITPRLDHALHPDTKRTRRWCPASEVRDTLQRSQSRTSEAGTSVIG
jgi:hypothetical protein